MAYTLGMLIFTAVIRVSKGVMFGVPHTREAQTLVQPTVLGMGLPHGIAINSDSTQRDDMRMFFYLICFSALTVIASQSVASPCDGVDRQISEVTRPLAARRVNETRAASPAMTEGNAVTGKTG